MKKIRIGNDIPFQWTITRNGEAEDFSDKNVDVYIYRPSGIRYEIDELNITGNVISGIFRGKDQDRIGKYNLMLYENKGSKNMNTLDSIDFIDLVEYSRDEGGTDCCNIVTQAVTLTTEITTPSNGVGIASVVQTTTSAEDGGTNIVTVTLDNGSKSTFEIKNGNTGATGKAGGVIYPTFSISEDGHLIAFVPTTEADLNVSLNEDGHLILQVA